MFGFLRRRAALRAPLLALDWDGRTLACACTPGALATLAIELDGSHFAELAIDADGRAACTFEFAPAAQEGFDLLPRAGRAGEALAAAPLRIAFGTRGTSAARGAPAALAPLEAAQLVPFGRNVALPVAVVVPVYNAPALVDAGLAAVRAHTPPEVAIIVIDDASSDAAVAAVLQRHAADARVRVLRNEGNLGFTATANRGIREAGRADVVLLNADAEVGPQWLTGLRRAAYGGVDVATATAVSDNAGAFSVPELEQANTVPAGWDTPQAARALWQHAGLAYPELPTGNGFCLYIRRSALDAVGLLDEAAFPRGYGEENDFCQRAARAGLRHLVAGNVFVRHARSASFGDERRRVLGAAGMAVLRQRWPDYEAEVGRTLHAFARTALDWRVRRIHALARTDAPPRPRLLWVGASAPDWRDAEIWNLRANGARNELVAGGRVIASNTWRADDPEPSYHALWDWLQRHAFEALIVAERRDSVAEILCGLLAIPVLRIGAAPFAADAASALAGAQWLAPKAMEEL